MDRRVNADNFETLARVGARWVWESVRMVRRAGVKRQDRLRGRTAVAAVLIWIFTFASLLPGEARAEALTVRETEFLVRAVHFEGLPEEQARRVGPEAVARLIEMLSDPAEASAHANILIVLGLSGEPGSLDAISDWASISREGEIDRDTFRAWQALPYALGHVARYDERAVARLEAKLEEQAPNWTFRHHRGARLHRQSRRATATALAMTGLPAAALVLDRAGKRATDAKFEEHLRDARAMHARRAARNRPQ